MEVEEEVVRYVVSSSIAPLQELLPKAGDVIISTLGRIPNTEVCSSLSWSQTEKFSN